MEVIFILFVKSFIIPKTLLGFSARGKAMPKDSCTISAKRYLMILQGGRNADFISWHEKLLSSPSRNNRMTTGAH